MIKNILGLVLGLMVLQSAQAQKNTIQKDTLLYYMKNSGGITPNKDSADYFMFIMPLDSATKLYPVNEFYKNGTRKLIAASTTNNWDQLKYDGPFISFYPNGKRNTSATLVKGYMNGEMTGYYPNGKLYCIEKYVTNKNSSLIECRDSLGKVLAENGNGHWLEFDNQLRKVISEGNIIDSLKDGEWHGNINDTGKYTCQYKKGILLSGIGYDKSGKTYSFEKVRVAPAYKGGTRALYTLLWQKINYPKDALTHGFYIKVLVSISIDKDGSISNIHTLYNPLSSSKVKAIRDDYLSFSNEVLASAKLLPPWIPGIEYGMPEKMEVIIPVDYTISH
ncbi:hypothetical protein HDF18_03430 [Mucilaginibacter sp. X5P1]|uniref:hypothetical protein n=1 Tax=Mucilaginibacter sp. X5P1 TaxID=2723088 RepID=UPI0016084661|nr:hypothetical protein [Mucilaginibacter sp. X5P1]MBB6136662.1 antitoxin component YwqK of YwqJK toxin-antitoxin module [Mucilaginibacter sp. X5P1]